MPDFVFTTKGLTAKDREQWEKDNIEILNSIGYQNLDDQNKELAFKNAQFKNRFGNREDYEELKKMSPELRDSMYIASLSQEENDLPRIINPIEQQLSPEEQKYNDTKNYFIEQFNISRANQGNLIGSTRQQWEEFDKLLDENIPNYKLYKGSNYFKLDDNKKIDLMATYAADANMYGEEEAFNKLYRRVTNEIANNQPLSDKVWNALAGNGATLVGSTIAGVGWITGTMAAIAGEGLQEGENYFKNIVTYGIDNAWTRYGKQVMEQGTLFTEDDPEKAYNRNQILRTVEEQENLFDNIFSINTVFELAQQAGFTEASMLTGAALVELGNGIFNTAKMATLAGKTAQTVDQLNKLNRNLQNINKWHRRWNAYGVPSFVGQSEAALNALGTKLNVLEESQSIEEERFKKEVDEEVNNRLSQIEVPKDIQLNGQTETFLAQIEPSIRLQVEQELTPIREDIAKKAEENADTAGIVNFTIGSFINGFINNLLKAPMFGNQVTEAIKRSKVGKLFSSNDYILDSTGKVAAKEITKKQSLYRALKETFGEFGEEYSQDVSDAFAVGGATDNLLDYIDKKYSGFSDDAISADLASNIGAAFAAAGRKAISKDAIQSGIYGGLGQFLGMPNINSIFNKATYNKEYWKNQNFLQKLNTIYRIPWIESYYNDKQENEQRRDTAKAINEWLSKDGNKEKLTTLEGSLNWAKSIQEADEAGDEYDSRNSRLGKLVSDYFMLEHLEGTPLYDAYMQRYMDILNAKEGDETAQQIAKYDNRELSEVQHDAQKMLDIMQQVKEATADIEKSLGNSIPQDVKESLIYSKITLKDRQKRLNQLEEELSNAYGGGLETSLTDKQRQYIALNGSMEAPTVYDKKIEQTSTKIDNLEKNKKILSSKQKEELKYLHKNLKNLQKQKKELLHLYESISKGVEGTPVLSEADIMSLSPEDRYKMLNPKNRSKYSQEQQEVIQNLIDKGTVNSSDFMNKIEDTARLNSSITTFLDQYNKALKNPDFLNVIASKLKLQKKIDNLSKSYQHLNVLTNKAEFNREFNKLWNEADALGKTVLQNTLKDNELYKEISKAQNDNIAFINELQSNPELQKLSQAEQNYVLATIGYLQENGYNSQNIDESLEFLTQDEGLGLKQWIDNYNQQNPNEQLLYTKVSDLVAAFQKATDILIEEQKELEKANTVDTKTPTTDNTKAAPIVTQEEAQQEQEKQQDQNDKKENTNKILESIYDRLKDNTVFSPLIDGFKDEIKQLFKQGKLSEESTIDDLVQVLSNTTYSSPENQAFGSEVVNQLKNPIAKEQQRKVEESKSEEKKAEGQQDSQQNEGGKAVINLLNYNDFNSETPKAIKDFYEAYEIDLYLRKNEITPNKQIHIAYLSDLSDKNQAVTLVALVEDENGPININGHKFQPIGVLPNSFEGVEQLNDKIDNKQKDSIIAHTTLNGRIQSSNSPMIDSSKPNISLKEVANIETYERLKKEVQQTEDADSRMRKASALANSVMQWIFSKIHVNANKTSKKEVTYTTLEYRDKDLKGGEYVIDIFIAEPWESTNKEGKSLKEVLLGGNYDEISTFNSRLGTEKILGINFSSNIGFCNVLFEYYRSHQQGVNLVEDSEKLDKSLQKWIRLSSGYHYKIEKIEGTDNYQLKVEGPIINGKKTDFILAETNKSAITEELIAQAVKNLFLDENGNFRTTMYNSKEQSIAKWNVDYSNFDSRKTDTYNSAAAQNDRANVFKDGLLTISYTRLSRQITQIPINNPINPQAEKTNITTTNYDNASMNPAPIIQDNSNNKPKPNQTENNTIEIVNRIIEDSKKVVRGLVNGTRQAIAVTRIIRSTNQTPNQKALTVGNIVDKLVRNILANKIASEYTNIDNEDMNNLVKQLEQFKRKELAGYEIISEIDYPDGTVDGVRVNGEIIIKSNEDEHKVPITATLDLLAYNPVTGKFRIYDVKTIRDTRDLESNKDSWKKQLYLYKKVLEDKYGITIESVHILPIKVNYNDNLEVQDNKLVFYNGQEYKGVEPQLLETVDIDLNNFNFRARLEYLTQEERDFIKGEIPSGEPEEIKVEDKPKPPVKSNSNLAAPSLQDSSAIDDLGLSSNDIQNGQDDMASSIYSDIDQFPDNTQDDLWKYLDTDGKYNNLEEFKEFWITLDQEEQEKALECVGFL